MFARRHRSLTASPPAARGRGLAPARLILGAAVVLWLLAQCAALTHRIDHARPWQANATAAHDGEHGHPLQRSAAPPADGWGHAPGGDDCDAFDALLGAFALLACLSVAALAIAPAGQRWIHIQRRLTATRWPAARARAPPGTPSPV